MQNMRKFGWVSLLAASVALGGCDDDGDGDDSSAATMTTMATTTATDGTSETGETGETDETGDESSSGGDEIDCTTPLSHETDIQPIWDANCVTACHEAGGSWDSVNLSPGMAYDEIVDTEGTLSQIQGLNLVESGDTATSFLFLKLEGTQTGAGPGNEQMPLGANPLSDDDISLVEAWIACGAAE